MDPLNDLIRAIGQGGPRDLPASFVPVESGVPYLPGSTARTPVTRFTVSKGLARPVASGSSPIDYAHVYMVLDDYLCATGTGLDAQAARDGAIRIVFESISKKALLLGLGVLGFVRGRPGETEDVLRAYREILGEDARSRFDAVRLDGPEARVALARQPLLGAYRLVLARPDDGGTSEFSFPPELGALVLVHAVAAGYGNERIEAAGLIGGMPAQFAVDLATNHGFNSSEDIFAVLDRTLRLWRDYGAEGSKHLFGVAPADLLADAAGLELEDMLSMAFAVWSFRANWKLGEPPLLDPGLHPSTDGAMWEKFLSLVAATPVELSAQLASPRSDWDFLAFQRSPIVRFEDGLLLLDDDFLLQRVTSGLYWLVHDSMKARSDNDREAWTHAWADMVESMCEDELKAFAPLVLGGGQTFYTEDDLAAAYGDGRGRADVTIDFGSEFGAFEIVSGQLTTASRIDGKPEAFRADLEKLIYKKVRQLDGTCINLLADPGKLIGSAVPKRPVQPVVITGGGLPVNPVTMSAAREYCSEKDLLSHPMIRELAVVDLGELEMLEGLSESGQSPMELIGAWKNSGIANLSLRNWLLERFGPECAQFRPDRINSRVDNLFDEMIERLGLRESDDGLVPFDEEPPRTEDGKA